MNETVIIGIGQINSHVGNLGSNSEKILSYANKAYKNGADVFITPELSTTGYFPYDLLIRKEFIYQQELQLRSLRKELKILKNFYSVIGHVHIDPNNGHLYNAASVFFEGKIIGTYYKKNLPNYSVFDEERYFSSGKNIFSFTVKNIKFGIAICEDFWSTETMKSIAKTGVNTILILNASPYSISKQKKRYEMAEQHVQNTGCSLIYVNMVGGQDELIFDGGSFAIDNLGLHNILPRFLEKCSLVRIKEKGSISSDFSNKNLKIHHDGKNILDQDSLEEEIWKALVCSVTDYLRKNSFSDAIIGLSGGIDSAIVLAIAVDALGSKRVKTVMLASDYTSKISITDASQISRNLGVQHIEIPIKSPLATLDSMLLKFREHKNEKDTTKENIQSRMRGLILMAISNKTGSLVLATGNKSELATGYCTLYGDMIGAFSPIKDVKKTMVYKLAAWYNKRTGNIPQRIIARLPSAELYPGQTDMDSLPEYKILDAIIELYVEKQKSPYQIVEAGFASEIVLNIINMIQSSEHKRFQAPVGPRITSRAFGKDWRFPITNGFLQTLRQRKN